jgi:hypothetical protein
MLKAIRRNGEPVQCSECGTTARGSVYILYIENGAEYPLHMACYRRLYREGAFS